MTQAEVKALLVNLRDTLLRLEQYVSDPKDGLMVRMDRAEQDRLRRERQFVVMLTLATAIGSLMSGLLLFKK